MITGFVLILLSPIIAIVGTPILAGTVCSQTTDFPGMCEGLVSSTYGWIPFLLLPLLAGFIFVLIAYSAKK